jgi:hypothetical protein
MKAPLLMKRLAYSLLLLSAAAGADTTKPERKKTDVLRWDGFSGPELETPPRDAEAFVVTPIQSGDWQHGLSFALAPVVSGEPHTLVVQGPFTRFAVPAAFVAPPVNPKQKLGVGSYVLFQQNATLTLTVNVGRVKKIAKDAVTVAYEFAGEINKDDVAPNHVMVLDGKLAWGAPVSFIADDGKPVLGWYVTAGRDAEHAWVLSVGKPFEVEKPKPLEIQAFKKGAKVSAVFGTTSVLTLKDGKQPPARQYLEPGTVVEVLNGGLTYKVKKADGGEVSSLDADDVFAR